MFTSADLAAAFFNMHLFKPVSKRTFKCHQKAKCFLFYLCLDGQIEGKISKVTCIFLLFNLFTKASRTSWLVLFFANVVRD